MSKLGERLQRIAQGESRAMGFGALAASRAKVASLALLVSLPLSDIAGIARAAEAGADALLLSGSLEDKSLLTAALKAAGDLPCGLEVMDEDPTEPQPLEELGLDFFLCTNTQGPSTLMDMEKVGKVLEVDPAWSDGLLRAADMLPIDALLLRLEEQPTLSIYQRMQCQRLALARHPLLVAIPPGLSPDSLRGLRDGGVVGVLASAEGNEAERIPTLRQTIDSLPPARRSRQRVDALLPAIGPVAEEEEEEEEEFP